KTYFDDKSDFQVGDPQIGRMRSELDVAFRLRVIPILRKDSLHLDDDDRELVRATIAAQPTRHVLVTHGTDTMVETARVLATLADRTIVLTGALSPARFRGSDAEFNIGTAVGAVQSLPPGTRRGCARTSRRTASRRSTRGAAACRAGARCRLPAYSIPVSRRAASDIMLWFHGGSNTSSTSASAIVGIISSLLRTSSTRIS